MILVLFFIILFLYYFNKLSIGIRNQLINVDIKFYCILKGKFIEENFIKTLESYNFKVKKSNNIFIVKYHNKKIIKFVVKNSESEHKMDVIFDHKYFYMDSIYEIINNYLKNNRNTKKIKFYKDFYYNDFLLFNLIYTTIPNINKKYKFKKIIVNKNELIEIQKQTKSYVSKIDIIISIITNMYFKSYNKNMCNIITSKSKKKSTEKIYYLGNPVSLHYMELNNKNNIATQVRDSYKQSNVTFLKNIDIYMTSWFPVENYNNNISEINIINEGINTIKTNYFIILCMKNNDYVINLFYL
jgi:hypothetical protein